MKRWQPETDRMSVIERYGNLAQVAGLKRYTFSDGKMAGVEAIDVDTGAGLTFTVLPGRGMDIAQTKYRGVPISYITKAGITHPGYLDRTNMEWLKSFFGGLVTTCGLLNAGPPCECEIPVLGKTPFGLHGDISNTAADSVCAYEDWQDGRYVMRVSGRMQEGRLHGEHLVLRREIETAFGEKRLKVRDKISNAGDTRQIVMFFYHINIGTPILSEDSVFYAPSVDIVPATDLAKAEIGSHNTFERPKEGYLERQYYHTPGRDENGMTVMALINERLEVGVSLRYSVDELPCMAQWKVMRPGEYVFAFEPGNCHPIGRDKAISDGTAQWLLPGRDRLSGFEIEVIDGPDEIKAVKEEISRLKALNKR